MEQHGYNVALLHPARIPSKESDRSKKTGPFDALISTDIGLRGFEYPIKHIINYEMAPSIESYVYRVGGVGSFSTKGTVITFLTNMDQGVLPDLREHLRSTGNNIPIELETH